MQRQIDIQNTSSEIIDVLLKTSRSKEFAEYAEAIATRMVTNLFSDAGRTWRKAAAENSQGRMMYHLLMNEMNGAMGVEVKNLIRLNAELITSTPQNVAEYLTQYILEGAFVGRRASDIAEEIKALVPHLTENKAKLISRTEASKASTALTRARSELAGVNWYVWRTSHDQRVRDSHKHMETVLINWRDAPSPEELDGHKGYGKYHAGNTFNCRCYPEPLVSLDWISWPHKVYIGGSIKTMTRSQFEKIM